MAISEPILAATVILVQNDAMGLKIYLVQRRTGNGFMAGNYVFPGGMLDKCDHDMALCTRISDLEPDVIEERLGGGLPWEQALAFGVAAIRETFEEAGVFLGEMRRKDKFQGILDRRRESKLPRLWLVEAAGHGCSLALSSLARWSWWITPQEIKTRFDTRFFLAAAPSDQFFSPDGREVVAGGWFTPEEALARNLSGNLALSPPTLVTLQELMQYGDARVALSDAATRSWGEAICPRFVKLPNGALILEPWDPEYATAAPPTLPEQLNKAVVPLGEPFSRLWCDGKIWRPIRVE